MHWQSFFGASQRCSVSPTKICPTQALMARKYAQLLRSMLCAVHQSDWLKPIGIKAASRMLMKLSPGFNFTNVLCAAFAPVVLRQQSTKLRWKHKKAVRATYVRKSCVQNVDEIESFTQTEFNIHLTFSSLGLWPIVRQSAPSVFRQI